MVGCIRLLLLYVGLLLASIYVRDNITWISRDLLRIRRIWSARKVDGRPVGTITQHEFFAHQLSVLLEDRALM